MKLFIPTSSLNFNNIMSCESISPFAFYGQRNYGYKTFEKVELNNFNNSLLLYEVFPEFQIPKSELVNYPMVIEVDIDSESEGIKRLDNEIWQIDRTIYLNPINSKIYFFSFEHKRTILSRSESSTETKLVNLYRNSIRVYQTGKKEYKLGGILDLFNLNNKQVENDNHRNKIKGFAYAYLIAANSSISKKNIQLKNVVNKIFNLSSAIVNSVSGCGTQHQNEELKYFLREINKYQYNDVKEYLKSIIPDQFNDIWDNLYNQFGMRIPSEYNFEKQIYSLTDKAKYETSLQDLKKWSNEMIRSSNVTRPKLEWTNIALAGNRLTQYEDTFILKSETKEMYQNLINDIFVSTDITESSFSSERSRLADEITRKMKGYIGGDWESSPVKKYLNALRKNIAGQEAFNIKWDTGLISAIASFLLKGDDFDKLNDYLISTEIEDGRLAFGLYGCICGYANLSRVFTLNLYETDLNYFTRIYKIIHKQLHNIELSGDIPVEEKPKSISVKSKINVEENRLRVSFNVQRLIQIIRDNVPEYSKLSDVNRDYYFCEINKCYTGKIDIAFIEAFKIIPQKNKTKTFNKKIISFLNRKVKETRNSKSLIKYSSSDGPKIPYHFDTPGNVLFCQDRNAFGFISSKIPQNELKLVKSEIEWIQRVYQRNGYSTSDGRWKNLDKHSNEEVITHLKNNASKNSNISPETIDIMIEVLRSKYCR